MNSLFQPLYNCRRSGEVVSALLHATLWPQQMTLSEEDDDENTTEAPVPTPSEVLDAIDLLRRYAGAFEGMEAALNALATYEKCMAPLLLTLPPQP